MMTRRQVLASLLGLLAAPAFGAEARPSTTTAQIRWEAFRNRFVTSEGRVTDTGNAGISHSEGQGVAMLAAAILKDEETFAGLWAFTRSLRRPDGLFSWKFVPGQGVADFNNATDGDLYITWALARAAENFGQSRYRDEAALTAAGVRKLCLVKDRHGVVLLPGAAGFHDGEKPPVVNPAYWVFPAFRACEALDPGAQWQQCFQTGLNLLDYAYFGRYQLPADWLTLSDPVAPWAARPARFGYEAIRVPLLLFWSGQLQHPSMRRFATYASQPGFPAWLGFDDKTQADYPAPLGFESVARLARAVDNAQAVNVPDVDTDYFSSSLTLLAVLALNDANR